MHSNSFPELDAPGLKARPSKANPKRLYWVARSDLARAGYEPETVRLHYDISNPLDRRLIEQACKIHQSEMLAWAAGARSGAKPFDGTIASLIHHSKLTKQARITILNGIRVATMIRCCEFWRRQLVSDRWRPLDLPIFGDGTMRRSVQRRRASLNASGKHTASSRCFAGCSLSGSRLRLPALHGLSRSWRRLGLSSHPDAEPNLSVIMLRRSFPWRLQLDASPSP